ncbi:MAG TPA: hypothetical protein VL326_14575 [Kofleriaceae bacterium]|jgi:hypothetical protein|nr:hypothetical protein [Kofleriaceae bacterium]
MRHLLLLFLLGGCFGQSDIPSGPTDATVLFAVGTPPPQDNNCNGKVSHYIGSVAFNANKAYAVSLQFTSQQCGGDSGANQLASYSEISLNSGVKPLGQIESDMSSLPRLAANDGLITVTSHMNQITLGPDIGAWTNPAGTFGPVAAVADTTTLWTIGIQQASGGAAESNNPNYPCCGPPPVSTMASFVKFVLPTPTGPIAMPVTPLCTYATMASCLVQNSTHLIYSASSMTSGVSIRMFPKTGTMASQEREIGTITGTNSSVPVGLAADEQTVVWAVSPITGNFPPPSTHCTVFAYILATQETAMLLDTSKFSCKDVDVRADQVYFAIVGTESENGNQEMFGRGIGRIAIASKTFESIDTSVFGYGAGIRRVHISQDGETFFGIDPYAMARFSAHSLDGKQEIAK